MGCAQERGLERVLRGGTIAESVAERHRRSRRLHERRVVLRHCGHHRVSGLRRLHVFRRLARRVPHGALDRRRAVAQRGQVHDGRRARVSLEPAAGARDGRALDADREHVLHDRADGRRGRPRVAAAARHGHHVSDGGHRHRRADDRVRGVRRNARDHLGADRQSHPADGRHDSAQHSRAGALRLQLERVLRRDRPSHLHERPGQRGHARLHDAGAALHAAVRRARPDLARHGADLRHGRVAAHPRALLHGPRCAARRATASSGRC